MFAKIFLQFLLPVFLQGLCAQSTGLLWEVKHPSAKHTSYLFGTMHSGTKAAYTFAESAKAKIEASDVFAMEMLPDENLDLSLMMALVMKDGTTLKSLFTEEQYFLLDSLLTAATGFPLMMLDNLQPIVLMAVMEQASFENDFELPLDLFLYEFAKSKRKKTIGIETASEQLQALQALSYKEQAEMISLELAKMNQIAAGADSLSFFYANGMMDSLLALNSRNPMPEKLERALLADRNLKMAERIARMAMKENVFAAIGALHLPGADGVLELLRQKGFKVEPVR